MFKDWRLAKFEKSNVNIVLYDFKTILERENTFKVIDKPKHTSRRFIPNI